MRQSSSTVFVVVAVSLRLLPHECIIVCQFRCAKRNATNLAGDNIRPPPRPRLSQRRLRSNGIIKPFVHGGVGGSSDRHPNHMLAIQLVHIRGSGGADRTQNHIRLCRILTCPASTPSDRSGRPHAEHRQQEVYSLQRRCTPSLHSIDS